MSTEKSQVVLKVGDEAPDFTLPTHSEGELNLAWYRGRKHVILAFYPGDWTPVCATQVPGYQKEIDQIAARDCQLLCVSVDSIPSHKAWDRSMGGLSFPLMSDYHPHGDVARRYGVFNEQRGYAERSVFLIDKEGIIRFIERVELFKLPDNERLFREIDKLNR